MHRHFILLMYGTKITYLQSAINEMLMIEKWSAIHSQSCIYLLKTEKVSMYISPLLKLQNVAIKNSN